MVARYWSARATADKAPAYVAFFRDQLVPQLRGIEGHLGALVFDRALPDGVEITVLTFWPHRRRSRVSLAPRPIAPWSSRRRARCSKATTTPSGHLALRLDTLTR